MPEKDSSSRENYTWRQLLVLVFIAGVVAYEALVIVLLVRELNATALRATDQVFILLALFILPMILVALRHIVSGFSRMNVKAGNLELQFEQVERMVLEADEKIENVEKKTQQLQEDFAGKLSTAEQALYPILGGADAFAGDRLQRGRLIVGSKDFAANIVVAELMTQFIEHNLAGVACERRIPNGGTITNYACLMNGWIDLFVDYTGTGCLFLNINHRGKTTDAILHDLNTLSTERFQFQWLKPLGTMTNYCLVMKEETATANGIETISDLTEKQRWELRFCSNHEFMNRRDGLLGLEAYYGLRFAEKKICSYTDRYGLLASDSADISIGHTTDPEIQQLGLRRLVDDRSFFPDYCETPIARIEALEKVDGLEEVLIAFSEIGWTNEDITTLMQDYRKSKHYLSDSVRALLTRKKRWD